ncbi:hypothetical protein VNO78_18442 [Psophocarpus tetragonolobus]|uniref:Benzyl alcohol O-benzoyltransferase n=1 Tax=Psophocarpus tetragonolobus TaxID=3891 RepID=A0AAN9XLU7_PSOTE
MFTVRRCQPELVVPARPTPLQLQPLSDIDDQEGLRFHIPTIHFYRNHPSMAGKDPVEVIRKALAHTLVFYYPFAGRLSEGPDRKLTVDCNGEGVMFTEAHADATLDQLSQHLQPPFPCFQQLLDDAPLYQQITTTPLLLVQNFSIEKQVTRLKCGGFILAYYVHHSMCDAYGVSQFMSAWAEMARGATKPSIPPVWGREVLMARDPPRVTCNHFEYMQLVDDEEVPVDTFQDDMILRSFFFGPVQVAAIRRFLPHHLKRCATFDVIAACLWRCRTKALKIDADEDVCIMVTVNARARFNPPLPVGYYGNAFAYPTAVTTAGKLCGNSLEYAVELINKVKGKVTEEYMHSLADLLAIKGRYIPRTVRSFTLSDLRGFNVRQIDFGWGEAVYSGPAQAGLGPFPGLTFLVPSKNAKGEEGLLLPIWLPAQAMNTFARELDATLGFISSLL